MIVNELVFGSVQQGLCETSPDALPCFYRMVGAVVPEDLADSSISRIVAMLPAGTLERRYILAHLLRALSVGGELIACAAKDKGGLRIKRELESFGCMVREESRKHFRICITRKPDALEGLEGAIAAGGLQRVASHGMFSQPGIFSWDRIDAGSALLLEHLPELKGNGADFGCGYGLLSRHVLQQSSVTGLDAFDVDYRAVQATKQNIHDARLNAVWADICSDAHPMPQYDFIIMNPPFHEGAVEDKTLGQRFIGKAAQQLRAGGTCVLVANNHLPYEGIISECFSKNRIVASRQGFKVIEAEK